MATSKFGQSVKVNDWNQTIVGSPGNRASYDGAVHVFNMDSNGTYSYLQKIDPPISGKVGQFGYSLSTDGNNLLIGAPDDDNFTGFVYAYIREANGSYNLVQTINSYSNIGDSFGWDLSASNQYLAASSRQTNKKAKFITGIEASFCIVGCLIPVSLGFFIPVLILFSNAITSLDFHNFREILKIFSNKEEHLMLKV